MKVLVCTTEYYPNGAGIANVVYNIVQELKEMGVKCVVCSPTGPDVILGDSTLIRKTGIIGMLNYWRQVSSYFKDNDYDIAWLQNPFFISRNPFKRSLVTIHSTYYGSRTYAVGNQPLFIYNSIVAHLETFCLTRMPPNTRFTGVGQPVCEELQKIGIPSDRITYILNGVNTRQFHPRPDKLMIRKRFGIPEDDIVLLSVGRVTHQKRPLTLVEIFSYIERKNPDVTLCIAGKGKLLEATKEMVQRKGLKKVLFLGYVDDQDLPDLYACSDYYIMTSKYEGGMPPLTLAEAMASGLPCIVSDIPNMGIVSEADCGIVVNFENVLNAANRIIDYLKDTPDNHAQNGRFYAMNFDWPIISDHYFKEYSKLYLME